MSLVRCGIKRWRLQWRMEPDFVCRVLTVSVFCLQCIASTVLWCLQNKSKLSAKKTVRPFPVGGVETTGHAASPATIVIGRQRRRSRPTSSGSLSAHVSCICCCICTVWFWLVVNACIMICFQCHDILVELQQWHLVRKEILLKQTKGILWDVFETLVDFNEPGKWWLKNCVAYSVVWQLVGSYCMTYQSQFYFTLCFTQCMMRDCNYLPVLSSV